MITAWTPSDKGLQRSEVIGGQIPPGAIWIDLLEVTREEELKVEQTFAIEVPTREEMAGIETSNRLYREGPAMYLTSGMLIHTETDTPVTVPVTFIVMRERVITLRYVEPWAFKAFCQRAARAVNGCCSADLVLVGILEATIERLADMLERAASEQEKIAQAVFRHQTGTNSSELDLQETIFSIGRSGNVISKVSESLVDKRRIFAFAEQAGQDWLSTDARSRLKVLLTDAQSLYDQAAFMSGKISFLLDATLGLISIEQNRVIKILSIASVLFLPPMVVSGIYGMNFKFMPELEWGFGYPMALVLMVASAVGSLWFFKWRKWL